MTIKQIQCLLTYLGYSPGTIDGIEGRNTQGAVRAFQADYGLTVDGIPGAATQKMLIGAIAGTAVKVDKPISSTPQKAGAFWDGIKYFKREEFRCPCGKCGGFPVEPKEALVKQLVSIREHLSKVFRKPCYCLSPCVADRPAVILNIEVFRDGDFWKFRGSDYHIGYTVRQFNGDGNGLFVLGFLHGRISHLFSSLIYLSYCGTIKVAGVRLPAHLVVESSGACEGVAATFYALTLLPRTISAA